MRLEIEGAPGRWSQLGATETTEDAPYPTRYRRAVAEELEANGVGWIITEDGQPLAADLLEHFHQWGARNIAYGNGWRLWRLE